MRDGEESPMQYTARCFTRVEIVQLDKSDILDVATTYPHIKARFEAVVAGVVSAMEESKMYRDKRPSAILDRSSTAFQRAIHGGAIKGNTAGSPINEKQLLKANGRSPKSALPLDDGDDSP
jgi:CRP-like cAMP-binding protein